MSKSFIWKTDRPWPNTRLKIAAIVGHTTETTCQLWLRTASEGDFTLLVYPQPELGNGEIDLVYLSFQQVPFRAIDALGANVKRLEFSTSFASDTTHIESITGLQANTQYCYALLGVDGETTRIILGQDRSYSFRTMPTADSAYSFGFYSCHLPYKKTLFGKTKITNMEMWECFETVLSRHYDSGLRFVIGGGDQVYADGVDSLNIWKYLNKVMRKVDGDLKPGSEDMLSWYRDIYRGYWGFEPLKKIFSSYPTYMIWDDHEIADGWGSHILKAGKANEMEEVLPDLKEKGFKLPDAKIMLNRMFDAGKQAYQEYQHSHNTLSVDNPDQVFDYGFRQGSSTFYFLDGRGKRDINRKSNRILGDEQLARFGKWVEDLDAENTQFLFVTSAVPIVHLKTILVNASENVLSDIANVQDDLRDSWEHELHDRERKRLLGILFKAAERDIRVCILSGDVHTSAVFRLTNSQSKKNIYQLTSSAITYSKPRLLSWLLGKQVAESGESEDGFSFERLALYTDSNFSIVKVDPKDGRIWFQLYGGQKVSHPDSDEDDVPMTHSIYKLELAFD